MKASYLDTPLGKILAVANETALYLLAFSDSDDLESEIEKLQAHTTSIVTQGKNDLIASIESELKAYFKGTLHTFQTPLHLLGSPFQKLAWKALNKIPYGQTRSYLEQATSLGKKTAYRAVANANGANQIAIVVPCHRVINSNGKLGGYAGGIQRKQWLLEHEKKYVSCAINLNSLADIVIEPLG